MKNSSSERCARREGAAIRGGAMPRRYRVYIIVGYTAAGTRRESAQGSVNRLSLRTCTFKKEDEATGAANTGPLARYIGFTARPFSMRVAEHLQKCARERQRQELGFCASRFLLSTQGPCSGRPPKLVVCHYGPAFAGHLSL